MPAPHMQPDSHASGSRVRRWIGGLHKVAIAVLTVLGVMSAIFWITDLTEWGHLQGTLDLWNAEGTDLFHILARNEHAHVVLHLPGGF